MRLMPFVSELSSARRSIDRIDGLEIQIKMIRFGRSLAFSITSVESFTNWRAIPLGLVVRQFSGEEQIVDYSQDSFLLLCIIVRYLLRFTLGS